jgi:ornithine decarboxylase
MKITIAKACSDLGVKVCGSEKGPIALSNFDNIVDNVITVQKENVEKELEPNNKKRNIKYVNKFNDELYNKLINDNNFVITIGGDHSIAIGSDLASAKKHKNIGIFWIDAHSDYHNMESTITGNIHGMPLCSITGENGRDLNEFFDGEYINPKKCVIIGARDIEAPEQVNLDKAGVTVFTTEDIKKYGVKAVMDKAYDIVKDMDGLHISYDLDVIDPLVAPGVSVKASDGINEEEAYQIMDEIINHLNTLKSFDLVEFNPDNDIDNKTLNIANNLLEEIITNIKNKEL